MKRRLWRRSAKTKHTEHTKTEAIGSAWGGQRQLAQELRCAKLQMPAEVRKVVLRSRSRVTGGIADEVHLRFLGTMLGLDLADIRRWA